MGVDSAIKANDLEFNKLAKWLAQAPKVVLHSAVMSAHHVVMQSTGDGGSMVHDTSNAAYNWRVTVAGSPATFIEYFGTSPVGTKGDARTANQNWGAITSAIMARLRDDAKTLDRAVWGSVITPKISLTNPISSQPSKYQEHSRVADAVRNPAVQLSAEAAGRSAFTRWEHSGPNVDWSNQINSNNIWGY
jgi:hypothetical protein